MRIESTVITLAPEMKIVAPVRDWQMGREEEIAYAREHGIPVKGGTEAPPYSIDDNIWGRSSEGGPIEDLDEPPRDDVFELVADVETRRTSRRTWASGSSNGSPVALNGERAGPGRADRPRAGDRPQARRRASSTTSRTGSSA